MNDRVRDPESEWTRQCVISVECSIIDFRVVGIGRNKETEVHVAANVKRAENVHVNEDEATPVRFCWKWAEEKLPIVDQYAYLRVDISNDCSSDTHVTPVTRKGERTSAKYMPF